MRYDEAPEVHRTPAGISYRKSRTSTPDIEEIKRSVEAQAAEQRAWNASRAEGQVLRGEGQGGSLATGDPFLWIANALSTNGPKNRVLRPQSARPTASSSALNTQPSRPQTARPSAAPLSARSITSRGSRAEGLKGEGAEWLKVQGAETPLSKGGIAGGRGAESPSVRRRPHFTESATLAEDTANKVDGEEALNPSAAQQQKANWGSTPRASSVLNAPTPQPPASQTHTPRAFALQHQGAQTPRQRRGSDISAPQLQRPSSARATPRPHLPAEALRAQEVSHRGAEGLKGTGSATKTQPMFSSKGLTRFEEMVKAGWTCPEKKMEDALHFDLRKGLSWAKGQVSTLSKELEEMKEKATGLEYSVRVAEDRCKSLQEALSAKDDEGAELQKENSKLLFIIGMREGEIMRLLREIDHIKEIRELEGRQLYEPGPGDPARPSSPFFNDIDLSARQMFSDLKEVDEDLEQRKQLTERMGEMVEKVSAATKKRVEYEASFRPVFANVDTQTVCRKEDMEAICAIDEHIDEDEDPGEVMEKIVLVAKSRKFHEGVPPSFKDCVMDSRNWLMQKESRIPKLTEKHMLVTTITLLFTKMDTDLADVENGVPKISLTEHVMEWHLAQFSQKSACDLKIMDLIFSLKEHSKHPRARMFSRLCGTSMPGKDGHPLPLETLTFYLMILHFLNEIMTEQVKRAKMSARERSNTKAKTDEETFATKHSYFDPGHNTLLTLTRGEDRIQYKKAQVCKVIKECMSQCAVYEWTDGDNLSFQEANRLMQLDEALEYAVECYEEIRMKRRNPLAKSFSQLAVEERTKSMEAARALQGGAENALRNVPYSSFKDFILSIDGQRKEIEIFRMYREIAIKSGANDGIDPEIFCNELQNFKLDRPQELSEGVDPFKFSRLTTLDVDLSQDDDVGASSTMLTKKLKNAVMTKAVLRSKMFNKSGGVNSSMMSVKSTATPSNQNTPTLIKSAQSTKNDMDDVLGSLLKKKHL